jgi:hypothetical protein
MHNIGCQEDEAACSRASVAAFFLLLDPFAAARWGRSRSCCCCCGSIVNCRLVFVPKQRCHKQPPTILAAEQETIISVQITSLERNSHTLQRIQLHKSSNPSKSTSTHKELLHVLGEEQLLRAKQFAVQEHYKTD